MKRQKGNKRGVIEVYRGALKLRMSFSSRSTVPDSATVTGLKEWASNPIESVYIPSNEILSSAPGFLSLYSQREVHFEEIYADILNKAYRPALRDPMDRERERLLVNLQKLINGKVIIKNEVFFLKNKQGNLEFSLLSEGARKLGLLWLLIQNGSLPNGSILFWDEPEAHLNPELLGPLVEVLLELQRMGVQVFLSTHNYVVLKEIDLRKNLEDKILFHSMYRDDDTGEIQCCSAVKYWKMQPNVIEDTLDDLSDRTFERCLTATLTRMRKS